MVEHESCRVDDNRPDLYFSGHCEQSGDFMGDLQDDESLVMT